MAKYVDGEKIGSGGFGKVYLCVRDTDGETFAKKILIDESDEAVERFRREVQILSKLNHPRIVQVTDKNLTNPPYWYAMPIYKYSLESFMPPIKGDRKVITRLFTSMLEGMDYAHKQGVFHRDLKPANILLNSIDDLVVSDFGLGLVMEAGTRMTSTGASFGTLDYMAPEQTRSRKNADQRSDIYSLGQILYEMYTGNLPAALYDYRGVPDDICALVERCTRPNPDKRFQSIREVVDVVSMIEAGKLRTDAHETLKHLGGVAAATGSLTSDQVKEFLSLVAQCKEDRALLHDVAIELPTTVYQQLGTGSPELTRLLVSRFADTATSQGWPFGYTDKIGVACERIYDGVNDPTVRAIVTSTALNVGVDHNRWDVMRTAANLIWRTPDFETALAVAAELEKHRYRLPAIRQYLNVGQLHPIIRELFGREEQGNEATGTG